LNCCSEHICRSHIQDLLLRESAPKFLCPFCNEENSNQKLNNVDKLIQNLLDIELHKFDIDSNYKVILNNLNFEINSLQAILKDPENLIYQEIHEIKRQVNLDREKLKSQIDDLADELIQKLEFYELKLKTEIKCNINMNDYKDLVRASKRQLNEYEDCLKKFSAQNEERDVKRKRCEKITKILQDSIKEVNEKIFSTSLSYKPMEVGVNEVFGKLIFKVILFFWLTKVHPSHM